ncbi:MAG: hypothetical protein FWG66_09435, partial [Spirochaetes bacterium]|nr:hypothetical protein [Spirochaetota bacterium]
MLEFTIILTLVLLWYAIVPLLGAIYSRKKWNRFRQGFDRLRLAPQLDYGLYRRLEKEGGSFRFTGGFESISEGDTLWIQAENLIMPVSLENTRCWLLPAKKSVMEEGFSPDEEAPQLIRWDHASTLADGAKVFVGGSVRFADNRWRFVSSKEDPLIVIFYDCPDKELPARVMSAWQSRSGYWNAATPVSITIGALALIYFAFSFLDSPAFHPTVVFSLFAVFVPLLPVIPPGLLFTVICRRLIWQAGKFRACGDIARLPLRGLEAGGNYGFRVFDSLPAEALEKNIPLLTPESPKGKGASKWHIFGTLDEPQPCVQPNDPPPCP